MELTTPGSPWLWRQTSGTYTQGGTQTLKQFPQNSSPPTQGFPSIYANNFHPWKTNQTDIPDPKELRSPSLHPLLKQPLLELAPILGLLSLCQNPNHDRNLLVTLHS